MAITTHLQVRGQDYAVSDSGGSGPAVVLLHGWPDNRSVWRHQCAYLAAAGYRVVSVDWLGHGESAKPQDIARYHVRELGLDLLAIIETLGLGRVHLVAHDYGATVAWETVADDPDPFLSFAVISVGHSVAILREIVTGHLLTYAWLLLHGLPRISRRWYLADDAKRFKTKFASHPDADLILAKLRETEDPLFWTIWERANPAWDVIVRQLVKGKSRKRLTVPTLGLFSRSDEWLSEGPASVQRSLRGGGLAL